MVVHAPVEVAVTTLNCHVYNGEVTFVEITNGGSGFNETGDVVFPCNSLPFQ